MSEDAERDASTSDSDSEDIDNLGEIWSSAEGSAESDVDFDSQQDEQPGSSETGSTNDTDEFGSEFDSVDPVSEDPEEIEIDADDLRDDLFEAATEATRLDDTYETEDYWRPESVPVKQGVYTWEHFKIENYYTDYDYDTHEGTKPTAGDGRFDSEDADESGVIPFNPEEHLGFEESDIGNRLDNAGDAAEDLAGIIEENTVDVPDDFDEDEFFSTYDGTTTVADRYDLEKTVPQEKKDHFEEIERYWVNKPFAFIVLYRSRKENETKYYAVEPYLTKIEERTFDFLITKLRSTIKYGSDGKIAGADTDVERSEVIEEKTYELLDRFGIYDETDEDEDGSLFDRLTGALEGMDDLFSDDDEEEEEVDREWVYTPSEELEPLEGQIVRPEPQLVREDSDTLNEYQVRKMLYYLKRDFVGFERIDPVKNDINVEDISVDGYNQPVFVYHTDYEQIISNIYHGEDELDEFVVKLAQRSGKGISKRQPQVDATLPDGSRAQLTLGDEVSDHGTNYTIRQFKDVPFTPIDLINWHTFSLDEMAFLWLCIENHKSLIFAGGTASGKTTSLNAVSLFIPSNAKIVSIEDTREVELPQRNWIASVTRPSFSDDDKGDVDEFDLLEAALRQRPDYIVMGEIRGEEGRTLFQVMSTGHTTYTTFHADTVGEVLKRFTTEPINVSKTLFTALDLVSIQTQTRVQGSKVRRNKTLTEVNGYNAENDEINVQDVYQWQAETDSFMYMEGSNTLEEIKFDRGWTQDRLEEEMFKRRIVLAYLIRNGLNEYAQVAATIQAFINDPETILSLMSSGRLEESLLDLREMESVLIDIDQDKEDMVPRPEPDREIEQEIDEILDEAQDTVFSNVGDASDVDLTSALADGEDDEDVVISAPDDDDDADLGELIGVGDDDGDDGGFMAADDDETGGDSGGFDLIGDDDGDNNDEEEVPESWLDLDDEEEDTDGDSGDEDDLFDLGGD